MPIDPNNPYTAMQRRIYAEEAAKWTPENRDPVVGAWDWHNAHEDYELLFAGLDTKPMVALDFGCGPGRMIVKYADRFKRIDGADIESENLLNALKWFDQNFLPDDPRSDEFRRFLDRRPMLYLCNGVSLRAPVKEVPVPDSLWWVDVTSEYYDLVYSAICLQHIPVHEIRMNLFREFFRVLKPGGWFTAQMGFGDNGDPRGVGYYENKYDADATNGGCDVKVTDTAQLGSDLLFCGFRDIEFNVRPAGPNDWHPNWIFFRAQKPEDKTALEGEKE